MTDTDTRLDTIADAVASDAASEQQTILTFIGPDRTGVLDELTHAIAAARCHIDVVRVHILGGWFTVLMAISGEEAARQQATQVLGGISDRLGIELRHAPPRPTDELATSTRFNLLLSQDTSAADDAADDAEAMTQLSNLLRVINVNISDVVQQKPGPGHRFDLMFVLDVPRDVPVGHMRELLGQICNHLGVSWDLHDAVATADTSAAGSIATGADR